MISRIAGDVYDHPSHWALALLFLLTLTCGLWPGIDIAPSSWFYVAETGFTWNPDGALEFVRRAVPGLVIGSLAVCFALWITGLCFERWPWRIATPSIVYLLVTLLVGPGLIVEALLKPLWGRARPKDIGLFGGDAAYTPPWRIAHECAHNCSFVSGHAAAAFWITAYAFVLPPRWRPGGVLVGLAFGLAVGLVRIVQGAHFISDVAAAGLLVILVNTVLARVILPASQIGA